jgi:hypothetical protein
MSSNAAALNAKINALNAKVNDGFARIRSDFESRNDFLAEVVAKLQSSNPPNVKRLVISRSNKTKNANKGGKRKTRRRY